MLPPRNQHLLRLPVHVRAAALLRYRTYSSHPIAVSFPTEHRRNGNVTSYRLSGIGGVWGDVGCGMRLARLP